MTMITSQILTACLLSLVLADPIEKPSYKGKPYYKPPQLINVPTVHRRGYVFGDTNAPLADISADGKGGRELRDQVCESEANNACRTRCIALIEQCLCGSNGRTYRNQCEMSCMRKVNMQKINWLHFGRCEPACSGERTQKYREMVKDMMTVEYLKANVKRCTKITNCAQAKLVLQYTSGRQSISECPQNLPAYLLFTHLDCSDMLQARLRKVYNNESVIKCDNAKTVNNKLFNDRNCALKRKGPDEKTLIQWAFDKLDANVDRNLAENELDMFSVIPDQDCGESFFTNCDTDRDGVIREDEWSVCLGCADCYRPCFVFQAKREKIDRKRRFIKSMINCEADGYCASQQCERHLARHVQCWCVNSDCQEISGTRSYSKQRC